MTETGSTPQSRSTGDPTSPTAHSGGPPPTIRVPPPPSPKVVRGSKPPTPKMGGLIEPKPDEWIPWTGSGKPKADFTGLENPKLIPEPKWYRPVSTSAIKNQYYRTQALAVKCTRDGTNLTTFQRRFKERLLDHGMSHISWIRSPADKHKLIDVIDKHGWFHDLMQGVKEANDVAKLYDSYSLENSKDAVSLLYNSIDDELEQQLYESAESTDCFAAH